MDEIIFTAPTGSTIEGLEQGDNQVWAVTWNDPENVGDIDFISDGPDADWANTELVGRVVYVDEAEERWFEEHLITGAPLPEAVIKAMRAEMSAWTALDYVNRLLAVVAKEEPEHMMISAGAAVIQAKATATSIRVKLILAERVRRLQTGVCLDCGKPPKGLTHRVLCGQPA